MNLDSIFSYGSPVDIIMRAITDTKIGNQLYKTNQPILSLRQVNITFNQSVRNPAATQGPKTLLGGQQNAADSLIVNQVSLSKKILDLLLSYKTDTSSISGLQTIELSQDDNEYWFNESNIRNIFVYEGQELIDTWSYNEENNSLVIDINDDDYHTYNVFYEYDVECLSYGIEYPENPWFSIEVHGVGNNGNSNSHVCLLLHKCKIDTNYFLSSQSGTNKQTLEFKILYDDRDRLILY